MQAKMNKPTSRHAKKSSSLRVRIETRLKTEKKLELANKKKCGRTIKADQLLDLALDLVTDEHIKRLQEQSLTNEDRKEQLRQRYIEARGPISRDEFLGFMLSSEFPGFLLESQSGGTQIAQGQA